MSTIATTLIDWLPSLTITGGDLDGSPFAVWPWEKRFIRGAFNQPGNAAMSIARGNGKSGLVAALATAVVLPSGPLHGRRREVVVVASSFAQARIIYEDVLAFAMELGIDLENRAEWRKQDSQNAATLQHKASGARVRCIGSDPKRAHGLRPFLVLADEPSQWEPGQRDAMLAALTTGLGKTPGSKLIALGTRSADAQHWFSRLLKTAPYSQVHAANDTAALYTVKTFETANPSMKYLPSLKGKIREEAKAAKRDPSQRAMFRSLRLNQGVSDTVQSVLLDSAVWVDIEGSAAVDGPYVLGIDLGTSKSQSAAAAYWPDTYRLDAFSIFPELPGLDERAALDGVGNLYSECFRRGELLQAGRRVSDIPALLDTALERWGRPAAIVADAWREAELRQHLEAVGFPFTQLVTRRMGWKDGSEDVRAFVGAAMDGKLTPVKSLLLRSGMSEARTISDPTGNRRLCKGAEGGRRERAKDDAVAASILAVSLGCRRRAPVKDAEPEYVIV